MYFGICPELWRKPDILDAVGPLAVYNLQLFCPLSLQSTLNFLAKSTIYKITKPPPPQNIKAA